MAEQNCCIRASAGTTVERDDLHVSSVSQDRVNERPYSLAKEQPTLRGSPVGSTPGEKGTILIDEFVLQCLLTD
jgi:hypothetical protein